MDAPTTADLMAATTAPTMAHRGASAVAGMPEMSPQAYDFAISRGHQVLEFSTNRTRDGHWVGVHDASLARTAGRELPPVAEQSRAEVAAIPQLLNGGPVEQFWLPEFLERYAADQVVMVDPKHGLGHMEEFLDVLDRHTSPDRVVVKFVGVGAGARAVGDAARRRGYLAAGFMYEAWYRSGELERDLEHWDLLGLEWDADPQVWQQVLTLGRPVIGHICADQHQADTARSRGAHLVQCAGVDRIEAVAVR